MIKKCVWILSLLVFSVMLVLAVNPPSLTNFMQLHGKVSNYFGIDEELTVQVGEDEDNVFHVGLNSDGTYGKNYAWKVYNGKPGDKLYFYIETQAMPAAETYQPQTVKEINLVLPPDCNNQKTWNWSWSKCTNKSKTGTFTCEGENKTTTETCCEPEWGNYTDWSECKNKEKSRIEFDVNQCDPASLNKTVTQSCGGSSSSSSSSGGPVWSCEDWSPCNSLLKKTRFCTDLNNNTNKEEVGCDKCVESWVCSLWTDCQYGTQSHTCTDLHACGTIIVRPALSRACEEKPSAFQQSYTPPKSDSAPPPKVAPSPTSSTPPKSTWDFGKYKPYLMGLAAFIVLAIIAVVVIFVIRKKSSGSEDYSAAENWAAKEKEAGLPEANIRAALANQGWEEEDINKILK